MNNVAGGSVAMRVRMRCRHSEDGGVEGGKGGRTASSRGKGGNREQDAVTHVREILSRPPGSVTRYSIVDSGRVVVASRRDAGKTRVGIWYIYCFAFFFNIIRLSFGFGFFHFCFLVCGLVIFV